MERKVEAIKFHLEKAHQLLEDAEVLVENSRYTSVISRFFYACFHAATALLLIKDLTSKTHKGLQVLLVKNFVDTGILDPLQARWFAQLFKERMEDDYGDFYIADKDDVMTYIEPSKNFIGTIETIVKNYEHNQQ